MVQAQPDGSFFKAFVLSKGSTVATRLANHKHKNLQNHNFIRKFKSSEIMNPRNTKVYLATNVDTRYVIDDNPIHGHASDMSLGLFSSQSNNLSGGEFSKDLQCITSIQQQVPLCLPRKSQYLTMPLVTHSNGSIEATRLTNHEHKNISKLHVTRKF